MNPERDLDQILEWCLKRLGFLSKNLIDLGKSFFLKDKKSERQAVINLGEELKKTQGISDLVGRNRTMDEVRRKLSSGKAFESPSRTPQKFSLSFVFDLPFEEAIEAILEGPNFTIFDKKAKVGIVKEMGFVYGKEAPITKKIGLDPTYESAISKVREIIINQNLNSVPKQEAVKEIEKAMSGWSKATAETIYRTQTAKAYSAGRWRQLQNPTLKQFVPAAKFIATLDVNVRPDHKRLHGLIFKVNNPVWKEISPPIYYNCRCHFTLLNKYQLKQMGRIDGQGNVIEDRVPQLPVPRFSGRQDLTTYSYFG